MNKDALKEAAEISVKKLEELRSKKWETIDEYNETMREYDKALSDLADFCLAFPGD